jgi:hypothetical protein
MANSYLKPDAITKETLRVIHNNLPFIKNIDKQHDKETEFGGQKRGASLRIRKPNKYSVRTGWTLSAQDQAEQAVTLTIGSPRGVDMNFTDADLALEINEFSRRFISPAVKTLASYVDYECFTNAVNATFNQVGTAGSVPSTALVWLQAAQKLNESAAPVADRNAVISPAAQANTVDGLKALFNSSKEIANQYVTGAMGNALGYDWYMSQNTPVHTTGSAASGASVLIDDAGATYAVEGNTTVHVDGLDGATDTFTVGDVITVAGVYKVNPETKQSTGSLQQFVVTTAATAASNEVSLTVSPAMYTSASGGLQNISAFPVDGAAVAITGSASTAYTQNLVFHPEAYTFASANLEMPNDVSFKGQMSSDGINVRILRQYDINSSNYPCRIDIFYGFLAQYPEFGCRVTE